MEEQLIPYTLEVISENEFTKAFRYNNIEMYVSKAYDEDSDKHFLINSIPRIPDVNVEAIQYPMVFENERQRNDTFAELDMFLAKNFIDSLIGTIKAQKKEAADRQRRTVPRWHKNDKRHLVRKISGNLKGKIVSKKIS